MPRWQVGSGRREHRAAYGSDLQAWTFQTALPAQNVVERPHGAHQLPTSAAGAPVASMI